MKKVIGIIILCLLLSGNAYARSKYLAEFNQWLLDNGHHQHLNLPEICITEPKLTSAWLANSCDKFQVLNNLNIKFYKSSSIPASTSLQKNAALLGRISITKEK